MLMGRCQTLLRFIGKDGIAPGDWLARVNDELAESVTDGKFVCVAAGYYDPRDHSVAFANAGFPPALLLSADDGHSVEFLAHGPPLAVLPGMSYGVEHLDLSTSALYFFSDGATEARLDDGSLLGMDGLTALIRENAALRPQARLRALLAGLRAHELNDDTTLLLIEDRVAAGPP
jgi:sigma-B regulation protein RsbU (phosphoserine phosphatase)